MPTSSDELIKQPSESILYTFDFTNMLTTGETLSSVTSVGHTVATSPDLTIGTGTINSGAVTVNDVTVAANKGVQARISVGADGEDYQIECIVVTSDSNTREMDVILKVRDR